MRPAFRLTLVISGVVVYSPICPLVTVINVAFAVHTASAAAAVAPEASPNLKAGLDVMSAKTIG